MRAALNCGTEFRSDGPQREQIVRAMKDAIEPATLTSASMEELTRELLVRLGEDPEREGLTKTPERFTKAFQYLTKGYREDPNEILQDALFSVDYDEMVIVKDIEMFSLCEHHVLPFFGKVHVAYIPKGKVIGLSKVGAAGGSLCSPAASSGAHDGPDSRNHSAGDSAPGGRGGD